MRSAANESSSYRTRLPPSAVYVWRAATTSSDGTRTQATTSVDAVPGRACSRPSRRTGGVFVSGQYARSTSSASRSSSGSSMPGSADRGCPAASRSPCSLAVTRQRPAARSSFTLRHQPAPSAVTASRTLTQPSSTTSSYPQVCGTGSAATMVPRAYSPDRSRSSAWSVPAVSRRRQSIDCGRTAMARPYAAGAPASVSSSGPLEVTLVRAAATPALATNEKVPARCLGRTRVRTVPDSPARAVRPARCR